MQRTFCVELLVRKYSRKFRRNEKGATALEFALLALPFFLLVFGILELALVFFTNTSLNHSVKKVSREIRTGIGVCQSMDEFKDKVCALMDVNECVKNLAISVEPVTATGGGAFINSFNQEFNPDPTQANLPSTAMPAINPNQIVLLKSRYRHKLILPGNLTFLSTNGTNTIRMISDTQAMRTEPFPAGLSSCGS